MLWLRTTEDKIGRLFSANSITSGVSKDVRHTDRTVVLPYASSVAHIQDFTPFRLARRDSPLLRSSLRLLNVRQVIYTRGFTARKILRKVLTSIETGVARREFVAR